MINEYDVKRIAKEKPDCWYLVDDEKVIFKENGRIFGTVEEFTLLLKKELHCDFDVIYSSDVELFTVFRCKECGTVIFAREDEDYDHNLCCPTCGNYNTDFKYWSKDDILNDEGKQSAIKFYEERTKIEKESHERYVKRGNKYDWQICSFKFKMFNKVIKLELECDNLFKTRLKGLRLMVCVFNKKGNLSACEKYFIVPLSLSLLMSEIRNKKNK